MANIFLKKGAGANDSVVVGSTATVYGYTGGEEDLFLISNGGVFPSNVVVDQTIEKVTLEGALADYTFKKSGTTDVLVYRGTLLVATIRPQTDDDIGDTGTVLAFTTGSTLLTALKVVNATTITLGGTPLSAADPGSVVLFAVAETSPGVFRPATTNGNVVLSHADPFLVFTPATGAAVTITAANVAELVIPSTITLTGSAAALSPIPTITGAVTVNDAILSAAQLNAINKNPARAIPNRSLLNQRFGESSRRKAPNEADKNNINPRSFISRA